MDKYTYNNSKTNKDINQINNNVLINDSIQIIIDKKKLTIEI
jgi:hypothetical protein